MHRILIADGRKFSFFEFLEWDLNTDDEKTENDKNETKQHLPKKGRGKYDMFIILLLFSSSVTAAVPAAAAM